MRVRELIEKEIDDAFEANTVRECAKCGVLGPVHTDDDHAFEPGDAKTVSLPVVLLIQSTLEVLLDIREAMIIQAMATGNAKLQTNGGIEIPGQGGRGFRT